MPRINRRLRGVEHVTAAQIENLEFGTQLYKPAVPVEVSEASSVKGEPLFENAAHRRAVWAKVREELMSAAAPGERPRAYYSLELRIPNPPHAWHEQLCLLESRGLLREGEEAAVEHVIQELNPEQSPNFLSIFDDPERALGSPHSRYQLRRSAAEFEFAAGWHARRGREELAERYRNRAAIARSMLEALHSPGLGPRAGPFARSNGGGQS
jgi:hypothetical protein